MRKIRIAEHISLDGVIQPGGPNEDSEYAHGGWTAPYRTAEGGRSRRRGLWQGLRPAAGPPHLRSVGRFLAEGPGRSVCGRHQRRDEIRRHPPTDSLRWGPVGNLGADVMAGIRRLKSQDGPDLLGCGSAALTSALLDQELVDEMVLAVYPVLLGQGKRCFPDSAAPREFALVSTKATSSGVLINTYRHVGSLRT